MICAIPGGLGLGWRAVQAGINVNPKVPLVISLRVSMAWLYAHRVFDKLAPRHDSYVVTTQEWISITHTRDIF